MHFRKIDHDRMAQRIDSGAQSDVLLDFVREIDLQLKWIGRPFARAFQ